MGFVVVVAERSRWCLCVWIRARVPINFDTLLLLPWHRIRICHGSVLVSLDSTIELTIIMMIIINWTGFLGDEDTIIFLLSSQVNGWRKDNKGCGWGWGQGLCCWGADKRRILKCASVWQYSRHSLLQYATSQFCPWVCVLEYSGPWQGERYCWTNPFGIAFPVQWNRCESG